jgi:hypothetical protein
MPREGYINLTLKKSVRDRLARIAKREKRTMTAELEHILARVESTLGMKGDGPVRAKSASRSRGSRTKKR